MNFPRNQAGRFARARASTLAVAATPAAVADRRSPGNPSRFLRGMGAGGCAALVALLMTTLSANAFAATAPAVTAGHPRLILDAPTLSALRKNAAANTTEWKMLKSVCDSYIGGTVNYPTGTAYPNLPNLGSGYQGESYLPALLSEALCYQTLRTTNTTAAATYGAKAVDILMKMAAPYGSKGWNPNSDDGYAMRFYGVGFGLGYDWLHDLLTPAQRKQVYTTANAWVTSFETKTFEYDHPQSNYFAGYFHAKAAIALGTYGDNPSAPAQWNDWYTNQFAKRVQPFYAQHLAGGGWPEGFGNYATLGIVNMSMPAREVKTATGKDIVHATTARYSYPVANADYMIHFTWPSRAYFDDRDMNHANGSAIGIGMPGTTQVGLAEVILGEIGFWKSPRVGVFHQYLNEISTATKGFDSSDPWLLFLETNPSAPSASLSSLPRSYFAKGMNAVAARSDWGTAASWMSFRAGPYTNSPSQGEQFFDQGSLALTRGNTPLLINASGWMVHGSTGSADEDRIYDDNYGSRDGTLYMGNRQLYNIFHVFRKSGGKIVEGGSQAAATTEDNQVRTHVAAFEDGAHYVYTRAEHIEDMYRKFSAGPAVAAWSREVVYLRPHRFVVHDRTTAGSSAYDQYLAWHFPAAPAKGSAPTGQKRLNLTYNGTYAGAMISVLPTNAATTTVALYPGSKPVKVWQVQERAPVAGLSHQWLNVFDTSSSPTRVASVTPVTVNAGAIVGVRLSGNDGTDVVINSAGAAGKPISGTISYTVPAGAADHVITELAPRTGYSVTVATVNGKQQVKVSSGGTFMVSANGVLAFNVSGGGAVTAN